MPGTGKITIFFLIFIEVLRLMCYSKYMANKILKDLLSNIMFMLFKKHDMIWNMRTFICTILYFSLFGFVNLSNQLFLYTNGKKSYIISVFTNVKKTPYGFPYEVSLTNFHNKCLPTSPTPYQPSPDRLPLRNEGTAYGLPLPCYRFHRWTQTRNGRRPSLRSRGCC